MNATAAVVLLPGGGLGRCGFGFGSGGVNQGGTQTDSGSDADKEGIFQFSQNRLRFLSGWGCWRLDAALVAVLPPCFIQHHSHCIGKVHATATGQHGQAQFLVFK